MTDTTNAQAAGDRLRVTFHPSLPEHARRLLDALDVEPVYDETAPTRCDCPGCQQLRADEAARRDERRARAARADRQQADHEHAMDAHLASSTADLAMAARGYLLADFEPA